MTDLETRLDRALRLPNLIGCADCRGFNATVVRLEAQFPGKHHAPPTEVRCGTCGASERKVYLQQRRMLKRSK